MVAVDGNVIRDFLDHPDLSGSHAEPVLLLARDLTGMTAHTILLPNL
jgi:hypothetical protein